MVSGGRSVGLAENFEIIYDLTDKLGGSDRPHPAIDADYVPNELQIG